MVSNRVDGGQVPAKQKELHRIEAEQTINELIAFLQDKPVEFMQDLYYFAYSTCMAEAEMICKKLKERGGEVCKSKANIMRMKHDIKKTAKKIYHAIR